MNTEKKIALCLGDNRRAATWRHVEITFAELLEHLNSPVITPETVEEYHTMKKSDRDDIKDKGCFFAGTLLGTRRKKEEVVSRSMLTLDGDRLTPDFFTTYKAAHKYASAVYTTHSHTPDAPRARILFPLARDITPDEYNAISRLVAAELGIDMIDPCSFEINQMMYWPTVCADGEYLCEFCDGDVLDPDAFLANYPNWRDCASLPASEQEKVVRPADRLGPKKHQEDPLTKEGIVGDFCRADTIQGHIRKYLSDIYEPTDSDDRWTYIPGEGTAGLVIYDDRFAYSHHATDPANRKLLNAFDLVRVHRFGDDSTSYRSMCELALQDENVVKMNRAEKQAEAQKDFAADAHSDWDDPFPLTAETLPDFPVNALSPILRDYALAVAESTQTAVDMSAVGCLTVISACMRNLYKVEGKEDWHEPTNIYSVIIADPSERKSANIALNTKPIDEYVREYNAAHKLEFEVSRMTKQRLENKKNAIVSASKKKGIEDGDDFNDALHDVAEQLINFEEKKPLRVYVDDTTPEKLVETLSENNNAVSIISSEGGIFDVLSGTYSSKVNIDVFLKAYSGEHISVDRIMRNSVSVDDACLTILLSVQPVVIGDLMKNEKFRHRGLTARFLYTKPRSLAGGRNFKSRTIPPAVYETYKKLVYNILDEQRGEHPELIRLTEEAQLVLENFYNWVEKRIVDEFSFYSDWIGKLVGNTLRIAGILARSSVIRHDAEDGLFDEDTSVMVDAEIMRNAIRIGKYFLAHAVSSYSTMGVYSDFQALGKAVDKIREKDVRVICRRDLMQICRWITSAEKAQSILASLEDYGYLRLVAIDSADKIRGGRPKNPTYAVNPKIF